MTFQTVPPASAEACVSCISSKRAWLINKPSSECRITGQYGIFDRKYSNDPFDHPPAARIAGSAVRSPHSHLDSSTAADGAEPNAVAGLRAPSGVRLYIDRRSYAACRYTRPPPRVTISSTGRGLPSSASTIMAVVPGRMS